MDRTGDVIELLVEHATDFRMCDLLDEHGPSGGSGGGSGGSSQMHQSGPRKSGDGPVGLGLVPGKYSVLIFIVCVENICIHMYICFIITLLVV